MIDAAIIAQVVGIDQPDTGSFAVLGLVNSPWPDTLTFLDQAKFLPALVENKNLSGAFVTPELAEAAKAAGAALHLITCEDPRWAYYILYNWIGEREYRQQPSKVAASASIHPTAFTSPYNVTIGEGTIIGPNVTVLPDVQIGSECLVQAGTVLGSVGFELKRTSRGILSVYHDGVVEIGDRVEIGANTCIDKGFRGRPTIIEDDARIDNLVHVAHSARVGRGAFVIAGTVLGGSCDVGSEAWLGINASVAPGIVVGNKAFVSIGGVVTRDVPDQQQVTGNFAIPHDQFLKLLKLHLKTVSKDSAGE